MVQALWIVIAVIALAMAAYMAYWLMTRMTQIIEAYKKISPDGVVRHDWIPTGRIDFSTRLNGANDQNKEQPGEFKLLVEERRVVESLAGNEKPRDPMEACNVERSKDCRKPLPQILIRERALQIRTRAFCILVTRSTRIELSSHQRWLRSPQLARFVVTDSARRSAA